MIEKIILDYFNDIVGIPAYMEVSKDMPDKFVLIEKTSSSEENYILYATIAIQSYANSLYDAACLNEEVKTAMRNIIASCDISKSKLNSDYNYTDTAKKKYRYQAVFDLVYFD